MAPPPSDKRQKSTRVSPPKEKHTEQSHLLIRRLLVAHARGARQARRRGARGARGRDELVVGHRRRRRSTARKRKRVGFFFASAPSAASSFWRALLESGRQRERAGGASRVRA